MSTVTAGILTGFGINADQELGQAFELAGARVVWLPVSTLLEEPSRLDQLQILGFPGGFSFGDHLGSGRVLAQWVKNALQDSLTGFTERGGLVLGVCNGFQTLVKMGILPNLKGDWTPETTLIGNEGGVFQDRWIRVRANPANTSPWLRGLGDFDLPIRHGEGRFQVRDDQVRKTLHEKNLIALTYHGGNPNGALDDIAGLTDATGHIFGLMPHPEAFTHRLQHPLWRRRADLGTLGLKVFANGVDHWK
ncbi:MAG: phosphoribosylformylglycinamidine synthase subunit PurQ [Spirochaetales bacterium]